MKVGREHRRCLLDKENVPQRGWLEVVELALELILLVVPQSAAKPQLAGAVTAADVIIHRGFPHARRTVLRRGGQVGGGQCWEVGSSGSGRIKIKQSEKKKTCTSEHCHIYSYHTSA